MDETRLIWLGLSLAPRIGPRRLKQILPAFGGDVHALWTASQTDLVSAGLDERTASEFITFRSRVRLEEHARKVQVAGVRLLTWEDEAYPALLARIDDPPIILYIKGTLLIEDEMALAIVGTRKASVYGRDVASHFARRLTEHGVTIISGLAHGIDAVAHRAALEAGGRTLAVLGSGIDIIYPYDHKGLAEDICTHGAVISEFPIGAGPDRFNFPRRNRLISGLSLGVLVVEASEKSGALITATLAAEQGKDVFAVPGSIFSDASSGANRLIQDGAKPVLNVDDILEELHLSAQASDSRRVAEEIAFADPVEATIVTAIGSDVAHIDEIARITGLDMSVLLSTLLLMELKGLIQSSGPMLYRRAQGR